jgi:hypothetical protein
MYIHQADAVGVVVLERVVDLRERERGRVAGKNQVRE